MSKDNGDYVEKMSQVIDRTFLGFVVIAGAAILVGCVAFRPLLEVPFYLALGWAYFVARG